MWIVKFLKECQAWITVKRVCKKNDDLLAKYGIHYDWFGRIYKVINRDVDIELGSEEDSAFLHTEVAKIWAILVKLNIADILAYELKPLDSVTKLDEGKEEFEHGYLIILTPAYDLSKQYVSFKSVMLLLIGLAGIITLISYVISCL